MSRRRLAGLVLAGLLAAGCSQDPDGQELPEPSPIGTNDGTAPNATATPGMAASGPIPEFCEELISFTDVARIVAVPITGGSSRTYATDFSTESGRTARLTCLYGVQPAAAGATAAPPPQVEISLSSYVDAAAANARLEDTVESARSSGQQVEAQPAGGHDGFLLADAADVTYVAAVGDRTLVLTVVRGLAPEAAERVVLLGLAEAVLGAGN